MWGYSSNLLCYQILANGRWRGELERNKEREQKKVIEVAEKLGTFKIEIYNCEYLSKRLRNEEWKAEEEVYKLEAEAVEAERLARQAEEGVDELEGELGVRI